MSDPTCEDLIYDQMLGREKQLQELFAQEDHYDELSEFGLCVDKYTVLRIDISTGGPADYLECKLANTGNVWEPYSLESVQYHYADWFDHAEMRIKENSFLWNYAEWIVEAVS